MDWKILIGVLLFLFAFTVYRCNDDKKVDFDKQQTASKENRVKKYSAKKITAEKNARIQKQNAAIKLRGELPPEKIVTLENKFFKAEFTSRCAAVKSFNLKNKQYLGPERDWNTGLLADNDKLVPINLVTTNPSSEFWTVFPLRLHFYEGLEGLLPDGDFDIVKSTSTEVVFKYTQDDQPVAIYKKYELADEKEPYQIWLTTRIVNTGDETVSFRPGIVQTGYQPPEEAKSGMFAPRPNLQQGLCDSSEDMFIEPWDKIEEPFIGTGVKFAGVGNNYFISAMIPGDSAPVTCRVTAEPSHIIRTDLQWGQIDLKPGEDVVLKVKNYMGPKQYQVLASVGNNLEKAADFGIFAPISKLILKLLFFLQKYVLNWGLAIIILTVLIKLSLVPLTNKSFKSSNAMKALKPEMDKLNEQYKDDPQAKQKAVMALYKQKGVNPVGGCLPMLLQMPIWFALFRTLRSSPELYRAPFFGWITDLSNADPYFVTPVVMGLLMFVQQTMTPMGTDNAQMKMMMYFMPVMFTVMMIFLPSGLTLYIMVNTILSILHQWILKKRSEAATAA